MYTLKENLFIKFEKYKPNVKEAWIVCVHSESEFVHKV